MAEAFRSLNDFNKWAYMILDKNNSNPYRLDVSIIIVNWNTRDILRDCLCSIFEQIRNISFEVIVIDNASSDGSVEMVKQEFHKVKLIENRENRGFAAANNQGIKIADGRYILCLNSDTIVLDGAIQKTMNFADKHTDTAVIGCKVLNPDMTLQPTCFMFPSLLNLFLSATFLSNLFSSSRFWGRERMGWWNRDKVLEVEVVTGCFMLVRHKALEAVGLMDESFYMYAEETDWCFRFSKSGWKNLFYPNAQIIHLGGQSSKKVRQEMILQTRAGILYFIKKHYSYLEYILCCFLFSLHALFRLPFWGSKVLFGPDKLFALTTFKAYLKGVIKPFGGWHSLSSKKE